MHDRDTRPGTDSRSAAASAAVAPHIAVCVPTYKRPEMLARCLDGLERQERRGFTYSIVVVDNDARQSARSVVEDWAGRSTLKVSYACEPEQNISLARNRAVASASGDYIAFIDDDEVPDPAWLANLHAACSRFFLADGALGPVLPQFVGTPPAWLVKSGLCLRTSFATGTPATDPKHMRTGNVLLSKAMIDGLQAPFDPRLGRTGGEDSDFFERMIRAGRSFIWCDEARVYEEVPVERQTLGYHVNRALVRGAVQSGKRAFLSYGTLKSAVAVVAYGIVLPVLLATRYHLFAKYLVSCCDHLGKLLGYVGIRPGRERSS
jgi:glycosyltransferase involved in cell wall biosynthesis